MLNNFNNQNLDDLLQYYKYNKIYTYFPLVGDLRKELYKKHVAFMQGTVDYSECMFKAANRVGKSDLTTYMVACFATGIYRDDIKMRKLKNKSGLLIWVCGRTANSTKEILQEKLMGRFDDIGTGFIPKSHIMNFTRKRGVPQAYDSITVKHRDQPPTTIVFKSFDQGLGAFEGKEVDCILCDETNKLEIYTEMLIRTMTTNGIILSSFTNIDGLTPLVLQFAPDGVSVDGPVKGSTSKFLMSCTWDDVPHLSEAAKQSMLQSIPPWQREARSKGVDIVGVGIVYEMPDEHIACKRFDIPADWPRLYAFDCGTFHNAAVWFAIDPNTKRKYIYDVYSVNDRAVDPIIHAQAIKSRGDWIPGIFDFQGNATNPTDLESLRKLYESHGLRLKNANKSVNTGLSKVWLALSTQELQVFDDLTPWFAEKRIYSRDKDGKIIKRKDHYMDATRYGYMGIDNAICQPLNQWQKYQAYVAPNVGGRQTSGVWMG